MQPRYEHPQERRVFLGEFGEFDLYLYAAWTGTKLEAVSQQGAHSSADAPELLEARRRAIFLGYGPELPRD